MPPKALDLLDALLQLDPAKRPSATQALHHPWLENIEPESVDPPKLPTDQVLTITA